MPLSCLARNSAVKMYACLLHADSAVSTVICIVSLQVRAFAVSVLSVADDEELLCYLLQLVQALRFERSDASPLASFLIQRCTNCYELSTFLHWYLLVEWQEHSHGHRYSSVHQQMVQALEQVGAGGVILGARAALMLSAACCRVFLRSRLDARCMIHCAGRACSQRSLKPWCWS